MHLWRTRRARQRNNALQVTISFSVEVTQEDPLAGIHSMDLRATPVQEGRPVHQASIPLAAELTLLDRETAPLLSRTIFTVNALDQVAQDEMRNLGTLFFLPPELPSGWRILPVEEAARLVRAETNMLATFNHRFDAFEKLGDHADAIAAGEIETVLSTTTWAEIVLPLKHVDKPLFHFLCDSLYTHTPQHIFERWCALRKHLATTGQSLSNIIRQAEKAPRNKWSPLVLELYFVLLDQMEALAETASISELDDESIECRLSAYCAALRIKFYLWRMTRSNPMCRLPKYKRYVKDQSFRTQVKQIFNLITQEFSRMQDDHFQVVERRLDGEPVDIAMITKPLQNTTAEFCTICQDTHGASHCVMPLTCECVFGRNCLEPLLNRDSPSSYACPNCRTRLHEPLKWQPLPSNNERGRRIGLLWALRHNAVCLKNEILADPDPFTPFERFVGVFDRLVYGR